MQVERKTAVSIGGLASLMSNKMKISKSVKERIKINLLKSTHGKNDISEDKDVENEENAGDGDIDEEEEEEIKPKPQKKPIKVRAIQADRLKRDKKYLSSLVR